MLMDKSGLRKKGKNSPKKEGKIIKGFTDEQMAKLKSLTKNTKDNE